jgi:hypothetical protein
MRIITSVGSILCFSVLSLNADLAEQKKRLDQELLRVPVPELPARAAEIVRSTPAAERSQAAVIAVENIVARYPSSAPAVVAAISKASPESAPAAASAARKLSPEDVDAIQQAARDRGNKKGKSEQEHGNGSGNGNGHGNGNGNGNVGRPEKPEHPGQPGRPPKSDLLPNGKPRPFPHHGHTDDPNHVHHPKGPRPYNKPKPH